MICAIVSAASNTYSQGDTKQPYDFPRNYRCVLFAADPNIFQNINRRHWCCLEYRLYSVKFCRAFTLPRLPVKLWRRPGQACSKSLDVPGRWW